VGAPSPGARLDGESMMKHTTFFEHYRICTNDDGSPVELSRVGAAISYKAVDTRSNDPVLLQLIPLATVDQTRREKFEERVRTAQKLDHVNIARIFAVGVDHEQFGLVSEYLEDETADSWIVTHGLMHVDAALRVGLQVIRAIGAAAFFGLTHGAIQPSNIMIVPGPSPDGGWPFVKVLNFGLAGLELHSISTEARELAPAVVPQFASPEQLLGSEIDFRSEIYSLGATICFLLTGTAPLAAAGDKARFGARRLPELRGAPHSVQKLLARMLCENPEDRPQDPVAFEDELRQCLTKIEKRQAIGRKLGIPLAATIPVYREIKEPRSPFAKVLRGAGLFAVLALVATALGAYFFPALVPISHRTGKIGVLIGVPSASPAAPGEQVPQAPVIDNESIADSQPATLHDIAATAPQAEQSAAKSIASSTPTPTTGPAATGSMRIASSANASAEPAPPSEGPDGVESAGKNADTNLEKRDSSKQADTETDSNAAGSTAERHHDARSKVKKTPSASSRPLVVRRAHPVRPPRDQPESGSRPGRYGHGWVRAHLVGFTRDGRMILRLPSGRIVMVRRGSDRVFRSPGYSPDYVPGPPIYATPRSYPPGYPFND
jgi:eukaryotic-like serine/threonine-protein kinase